MNINELVPTEWVFVADAQDRDNPGPRVTICRMVSPYYDGVRYAVRLGGMCLSVKGGWEYEPQPSNRDEAFYDRFRFKTFARAFRFAKQARKMLARAKQ